MPFPEQMKENRNEILAVISILILGSNSLSKYMDDLTTEAYWNVMMDRKAERHRERNLHNVQPHFMRTSKVALRINDTLILGPVKKALMRKCPV